MSRLSVLIITAALSGCYIELPEVVEPDCDDRVLYYADADADGWADGATGVLACEAVEGHLAEAESAGWDCDDDDAAASDDCGTAGPGDGGADTAATSDTGAGPTDTGAGPTDTDGDPTDTGPIDTGSSGADDTAGGGVGETGDTGGGVTG